MKVKFDSKQFGITLFIIYLILIIPLTLILIKTGDDLNKLAMNPGFITADEIRDDFPKLFFVLTFSFIVSTMSIVSFMFYIKRNKTSIDFDETIDLELKEDNTVKIENNAGLSQHVDYKKKETNIKNLKKELIVFQKKDTEEQKSEIAISYLCKKINAGFGAIYLANQENENHYLEFSGGYAFFKHKSNKILFGEGLTGQVARSQNTIIIDNLTDNQITVFSGLGKSSPRSIIISPIIKSNITIGVIEIATFQKITNSDKEMIEAAAQLLSNEY